MLRAVRLLLTLHCDESERLISQSLDTPLSGVERWAVRLHFISCRPCRGFRKQMEILRTATRRRAEAIQQSSLQIPADLRERIVRRLRDETQS